MKSCLLIALVFAVTGVFAVLGHSPWAWLQFVVAGFFLAVAVRTRHHRREERF